MLSTLIFGGQTRSADDIWDRVAEGLGGGPAESGVRVTPRSALGYSAVWRAVSLIAGDVAKIPLFVFRRTEDGRGKERASDHAAFRLMRWKPNSEQTAQTFREQVQQDVLLHGNGYAFIERNGDGTPAELRWLDPTMTYPERKNGSLRYVHKRPGGDETLIPPENVFHVRGLGAEGLAGLSVLSYAKETFGLAIAARDYGSLFFGNNSVPPMVLETDHNLTDKQRDGLRSDWERMQGGKKTHKTAVLPMGVHPKQLAIPAKDAMLLETREFSIREIANYFGVPPHKIGDTTRTSFASLEQENQSYLSESLDRWLCAWEFECWAKLLTIPQQQRDSHFFEFERKSILRIDSTARAAYNRTALGGAPWETVNEVRAKENLDPLDDPMADELQWPLNMGNDPNAGKQGDPVPGDPGTPPDPTPEPDASPARSAVRGVLVEACERVAKRIGIAAEKVARTKPKGYVEWLTKFEDEHREVVSRMLTNPTALLASPVVRPAETLLGQARRLYDRVADEATVEQLPEAVRVASNDFAAWAKQWAEERTA